MMRSFVNMYRQDVGFDTSRLLTMSFILPSRKYVGRDVRVGFVRRMRGAPERQRLDCRRQYDLHSADVRRHSTAGWRSTASPRRPARCRRPSAMVSVGPRYFEALGVRLLRGRPLIRTTERLAEKWPSSISASRPCTSGMPIQSGSAFVLKDESGAFKYEWATIVGVAPNMRQAGGQDDPQRPAIVYIPQVQNLSWPGGGMILVRGRSNPGELAALVRKEMFALDPDLAVNNVQTMDENLAQQRWFARVFGTMFSAFAGIAIVLAAVGLFAVTAYSVTQRTQEIGVRMALGAEAKQVSWLILRRGLVHLGIGLTLGLAGAFAVGRLLRSMLFQTGPADPVTLVSVTLLLIAVAISASLWPAWQASRLDPVTALRYE